MLLTLNPERPLDRDSLEVIRAVQHAATDLGLDIFIVGATASVLLLEHVHGMNAGRATRDIDFAFAIQDWKAFEALKTRLCNQSTFRKVRQAHRLEYTANTNYPMLIDLIPFGAVADQNGMIAWPPEMAVLMSVAGFCDAHAGAVQVELEPSLSISVASLPGLVLLKIFAWSERGAEVSRDANDLLNLFRRYHEIIGDRLYQDGGRVLEIVSYDVELAGARLLGEDVAKLSSPSTRRRLTELMEQIKTRQNLSLAMAAHFRTHDDPVGAALSLLQNFFAGFDNAQNV